MIESSYHPPGRRAGPPPRRRQPEPGRRREFTAARSDSESLASTSSSSELHGQAAREPQGTSHPGQVTWVSLSLRSLPVEASCQVTASGTVTSPSQVCYSESADSESEPEGQRPTSRNVKTKAMCRWQPLADGFPS